MAPAFQEIEHGSPRYLETLEIRNRILRAPLGLEFEPTEITAESTDFHLVSIDPEEDRVAGCLVLSPVDAGLVHMRQVAVIEPLRGRGIGIGLVMFSEEFAAGHGFSEMKLHARKPVIPFYQRLGYRITGEPFIEVTIPHREMRKPLS